MDTENQVCTLEQAQKLKDLGVLQSSTWYWEKMKEPVMEDCARKRLQVYFNLGYLISTERVFSAFTVAELGVMLCHVIRIHKVKYKFRANLEKNGMWHLKFRTLKSPGVMVPLCITQNTNEAIARADMLIKLLEKNYLTVYRVNKRLQGSRL